MIALRLTTFVAVIVFTLGCSSSSSEGEVSGSVTVDGKPAETGSVSFFPLDGQGPTAGGIITNGHYSGVKVPVGPCRVEVRVSIKIGERKLYDTADSPVQPMLKEILPAKYNDKSELKYDVVAGSQEKNWDLTTK